MKLAAKQIERLVKQGEVVHQPHQRRHVGDYGMKRQEESRWFKAILTIINEHHARALGSVNVEHLLACWQIGGVLSAKIKHDGWGRATIDRLVDFIHVHAPEEKGYGRSNLYSMVAVYEAFSSEESMSLVLKNAKRLIVQPTAGQLRSMLEVRVRKEAV